MTKFSELPRHAQQRLRIQYPDIWGAPDPVRAAAPALAQSAGTGKTPPADSPQKRNKGRVVVSIIGLRRRPLDDDNFSGGAKALRDCIAASLGLDDGDKRLRWQYGQLRTDGREGYLVRIERL